MDADVMLVTFSVAAADRVATFLFLLLLLLG